VISGSIVALVIVLAVVRELVPMANLDGAQLLHPVAQRNLVRPVRLLGFIVAELSALTLVARIVERRRWRPAAVMTATSLLAVSLGLAYSLAVRAFDQVFDAVPEPFARAIVSGPTGGLQVYALWVLGFWYPKVSNDQQRRALEGERLRRVTEIARLREHLQPHFLRNTLNAISAFVTEEPDQARDLLAALGDLLAQPSDDAQVQTLAEEIAWLRRYAGIFEARHRGQVAFVWDLDPSASSQKVPRLLLQPLVENAVQHGALAREQGGQVAVRTRRAGGRVTITVEDDGPGFDPARASSGLGLRLVRRRLELECSGADLRIDSSSAGTCARVELW
jgi:signal transduction histidine kinase